MGSFSLSLERNLAAFVESQVIAGVAKTPEDYCRHLIRQEMIRLKKTAPTKEA